MSSPERPTKIRKLSHGISTDDTAHLADPAAVSIPAAESAAGTEDQSNESELNGIAANNVAPTNKDESRPEEGIATKEGAAPPSQSSQSLSKNQLKKLRKKEEWEAGRAWRRARQKEKDAEKKARKREQREREEEERRAKGLETEAVQVRPQRRHPVLLPVTFIIDCGFDDKMTERERISLGSQLTRSYSDNSRAPFQARLMVTSWGGHLKERFDTVLSKHHERWKGMEFLEEDFVVGAETAKQRMSDRYGGKLAGIFAKYAPPKEQDGNGSVQSEKSAEDSVALDQQPSILEDAVENKTTNGDGNGLLPPQILSEAEATEPQDTTTAPASQSPGILDPNAALKTQGEIIYLTSDSPNTLTDLNPYSTYIIGGIVDKNRHKGICYKIACDKNIKTAKLPISDFMEMQSRFVLATNHVVEIMVRWLECGDWAKAFMQVIPKRKGGKLRNGEGREAGSIDANDEDESEGGDGDGDAESTHDECEITTVASEAVVADAQVDDAQTDGASCKLDHHNHAQAALA